jgi:hypothetical protein
VRAAARERSQQFCSTDRLSQYDWKVIEVLVKLLKPFEVATKQLQGNGIPGTRSTCGSFDEHFPVFEILLDHRRSVRMLRMLRMISTPYRQHTAATCVVLLAITPIYGSDALHDRDGSLDTGGTRWLYYVFTSGGEFLGTEADKLAVSAGTIRRYIT